MLDAASPKSLSIHLDESGNNVMASFVPDAEAGLAPITSADFKQAVTAAGFDAYRPDDLALENATSKYNSGIAFDIVVAKAVDGKFSITLSDDHVSAWLSCESPMGGTAVTLEHILEESKRKGITIDLNLAAIEGALPDCNKVLIAAGRLPEHGVDGRIDILIPKISNRTPHVDKDGLADFRELGDVLTVREGDPLVRHIPATDGLPGITLSGKPLPAKKGKEISFASKLDGVIPDPNDPNVLVAAIHGCPVQQKNEIRVEPVYTVQNVDLHSGNISFDGTIHVTGDVHTGMTIKGTGDILIDGTVEGAHLEAEGDITIKGGILGLAEESDAPHSMIKCAGSCTTRFAQNAHIAAGSGIFIHDYAMQSELRAGHQIIVGDQGSRRGDLIGGVAHAAMLLKAHVLGSDTNVNTVVIAGADKALHERLKAAAETREAAEHKLTNIIKLLELDQHNPVHLPANTIKAIEATREASIAEIESIREDEAELQAEIDLTHDAQVIVEKRIFTGVEVRFGLHHHHVIIDREGGVFQMKDGELVFE